MTKHVRTLSLITVLHAVLFMGVFILFYTHDGSGRTLTEAAKAAAIQSAGTGLIGLVGWHYLLKKMAEDNKTAA